jgi:four helix bundle protein
MEHQEKSKSFQDLIVWQKSYAFTLETYRCTKEELYGITSQLRRAAASVTANITEGYRRLGKADKLKFFNYSESSLDECKFFIMLSHDLNYLNADEKQSLDNLTDAVSRLLVAYCKSIINSK